MKVRVIKGPLYEKVIREARRHFLKIIMRKYPPKKEESKDEKD